MEGTMRENIRLAYVQTSNDPNGNPRRGWLMWDGQSLKWVEEGYHGNSAILEALGFNPNTIASYDQGMDWLYSHRGIRANVAVLTYEECRRGQGHQTWIGEALINNSASHLFHTSAAVA
jgi:hypothetical protein